MSSHREHRYQLLARDIGHTSTTTLVASFTVTATALGWIASTASTVSQVALGVGLALLAVLYLMLPSLLSVRPAPAQPASPDAVSMRPASSDAVAIRPAKGGYSEPAVTAAPTDSIAALARTSE